MKTNTLFLVLVFFVNLSSLYSQEKTNKYLIGGTVGFMYSKTKGNNDLGSIPTNKSVSYSGSPFFGYFFNKNGAAGLTFDYSISNTSYSGGFTKYFDIRNYIISPFIRYYSNNFFEQAQLNYGWSSSESKVLYIDPNTNLAKELLIKNRYSTMGYGLGLGYNIKIADNVFVEPMLRYMFNILHDKETNKYLIQNSFFLNIGIVVKIEK